MERKVYLCIYKERQRKRERRWERKREGERKKE
jgi:hypothetical protein